MIEPLGARCERLYLAGLDRDGIKPHRQMGSPTRLQTRLLPAAPPRQRPRFDITASQQAFVRIDSEPAIADLGWQPTDLASRVGIEVRGQYRAITPVVDLPRLLADHESTTGTADLQGLDFVGLHIDRGGSVSSPNQQLIA